MAYIGVVRGIVIKDPDDFVIAKAVLEAERDAMINLIETINDKIVVVEKEIIALEQRLPEIRM